MTISAVSVAWAGTVYSENFESGTTGFSLNGLWKRTANFPANGSYALGYVQGETPGTTPNGNYNTGFSNSASAFSPYFIVPAIGGTLTFKAFVGDEYNVNPAAYDRLAVYASTDRSTLGTVLASSSPSAGGVSIAEWGGAAAYQNVSVNLAAFAGQTISLAFNFDTIDENLNNFPGVRIDDLLVTGGGTSNWTNTAGGSWQAGSNWSAGVPSTSFDDAYFTIPGPVPVTIDAASAAKNIVVRTGFVTFGLQTNALTAAGNLYIADTAAQGAIVNVTGKTGSLTTGDHIYVGFAGDGTLIQSGGNVFTAASTNLYAGRNAGSTGTCNLSGGTITLGTAGFGGTLIVGNSGSGTVNQSGGTINCLSAWVAANAGSTGQLNAGGTLNSDYLYVGGSSSGAGGAGTMTITGTVNAPGGTVAFAPGKINLAGGTLKTASLDLGGAASRFNWTAGTLQLTAAGTRAGTITVPANGTLSMNTAAYADLLANTPGIDLKGGRAIFDYTGNASPLAQIRSLLQSGYAANFASGVIRSTNATAARGLGYTDDGTKITVAPALYGDTDLNGTVDFNDFLILQTNFGATNAIYGQGDYNYDGVVNFNDFLKLQSNFSQTTYGMAVPATASQAAAMAAFAAAHDVPEPAAALSVFGLLANRRRRQASVFRS